MVSQAVLNIATLLCMKLSNYTQVRCQLEITVIHRMLKEPIR